MRNMDPTSDPLQAFEGGFYVPPPEAVGRRVSTRLELEPTSNHLIIGGIGSGKTTELIQVEKTLGAVGDVLTARVDVPAVHRVDKLKPGVLIALAAAAAVDRLKGLVDLDSPAPDSETLEALRQIDALVKGRWESQWDGDSPDYDPDDLVWVKGIIEAPQPRDEITKLSEALAVVKKALGRGFVVIFDGLDRVLDPAVFASIVREDVPAIRQAGVGLVVVGPQHVRLGEHRYVVEFFTDFHFHGASSFHAEEGVRFLEAVLLKRAGEGIFAPGMTEKLATWSGGLLRDLISLARAAGEEAYVSGTDLIERTHIDAAADRFGRNLLLSATSQMASRLKDLVPRKVSPGHTRPPPKEQPLFVVSSDLDILMLLNRLIVEIPGTPVRYIPHPTIVPLIRGMAGGA
ncbi:MAG TPA: hypothetical protein VE153_24960 [Myxococcus sp.]|nr:hypothetical protein [Myxococcus sp.]